MHFFHYTDLHVGDVSPAEVLRTVPGRQSLYWRSVFGPGAYEAAVEDARRRHPTADDDLVRRAGGCTYLERCMREVLFESVRAATDPQLPSRSDCLFLFPDVAVPIALDVSRRTLLEIAPEPGGSLFRTRGTLLDGGFLAHDVAARAREYWRGSNGEFDEVLFSGAFRVVRVVKRSGSGITIDGRSFVEAHRA
jgi:hypothetical protein